MKKIQVNYIIYIAVLQMIFLLVNCSSKEPQTNQKEASVDSTTLNNSQDILVFELDGIDSLTVFEILIASHQVDYKSSVMGIFIKAIDSIYNSSGLFWLYSVNDSMAQVACNKYITSDGDKIKWHYRKAGN